MKYDINFLNNPFDGEACDRLLYRELRKQILENIRLKRKIDDLTKEDDIPSAYPGSTLGLVYQERKIRPTFDIDKVIFNPPATIVFWLDGTKTVVKCKEGEEFSEWAGIALCLAKRLYGPNFHKIFKAHCSDPDKIEKSARISVSSRGAPTDGFLLSMKEATKNATEIIMDLGKYTKDSDAK